MSLVLMKPSVSAAGTGTWPWCWFSYLGGEFWVTGCVGLCQDCTASCGHFAESGIYHEIIRASHVILFTRCPANSQRFYSTPARLKRLNYKPLNYKPPNYKPLNYKPLNYKPLNYMSQKTNKRLDYNSND
jgi:hypothetical protein